jgi:putative phage-type endonuclease
MFKILADIEGFTEEQWLEMRKKGIGGSEVAAICGISPWGSPKEVYLRKKDILPPVEKNDSMYFGTILEDVIAKEFLKRHPEAEYFTKPQFMFQSAHHPFMIANIDGHFEIDGETYLFEAKTASREDDWEDGVPEYYQVQVQHYLYVMGFNKAFVAVLFNGRKYKEFEINRDEAIIEYLIHIEKKFWEDFENNIEPEITVKDAELIDKIFPNSVTDKSIELPHCAVALQEFLNAKQDLKKAQELVDYFEALIKEQMKDSETAFIGANTVTWKTITTNKFDTKAYQEKYPDSYKQFVKQSSYRRFTVKEPKTKKVI